ncbi:hypothetical protein LR48_Vigan317s002100 [Vigna angularis]|uniref:DUF8039 domain-containing protein n=1 Tax=Phaseolus angularis TaxID=3914 RepID=A0A0L9T864_PHAAN|nr:hypothetical protein LR48_Vigan317s002100 [Vigna angularis]
MVDHPHSSGDEAPSSRPTKRAIKLKQLMVRRNSGERTPVDVNVITGVASGPNADAFRSYLGVLARERINILTPSFEHVSEVDRNIIWNDLLTTFDIPNVTTLKNNRQDILTTAIGRPEHPRRVCAAFTGVGIRGYFGSSSHHTSYAYNEAQEQRLTQEISKKLRAELRTELRTELYDEVTTEVTDRFMRQFQQQFERRSRKGSCSAPAVPRDDMDDASPCLLYILDGTGTMLVAHGTVFEAAIVIHGMELSEDGVKVSVDDIIIPDASVPLPTDAIFTVAQAFQSFIAWPKHLVGSVFEPLTHGQEKIYLSKDDPVGALQHLCDIIGDEPMKVEYDANVFGRGSEVPIYLHSQDVRELASGREELNITLIQLWMTYMFDVSNNLGYNDVYGFIDPQVIHETNDFDDITTYLTSRFGSGKEIYFIPYIFGSIVARMMLVERSTANDRKLAWVALKRFRTHSPLPKKPLTFLRKAFAKHLVKLYNSS